MTAGIFRTRKSNKPYALQKFQAGNWHTLNYYSDLIKPFRKLWEQEQWHQKASKHMRIYDTRRKLPVLWPAEDVRHDRSALPPPPHNSNFIPEIWSKMIIDEFHKSSLWRSPF